MLRFARDIDRDNEEFVRKAVIENPTEFLYASERLWNDLDMLEFVKKQCQSIKEKGTRIINLIAMIDKKINQISEIDQPENQ